VVCKLSGLTMPVLGFGWSERGRAPTADELEAAIAPLLRAVIDIFGVERCMFASNFPVDKVSVSLEVLWEVYRRVASDFTEQQRRGLFHDNAAAFYRVTETPT
jgi:predicted TIM-barrel fold metal-dependent hydrolase